MNIESIVEKFWEEFDSLEPLFPGQKEPVVLLCGMAFHQQAFTNGDFDDRKIKETDKFEVSFVYNPLMDDVRLHGVKLPNSMYNLVSCVPVLLRGNNEVVTFDKTWEYIYKTCPQCK